MAKEETPDWVKTLIAKAVQRAGNPSALAKRIKISPSNFINYDSGSVPSAVVVDKLLKFMRWDIERVIPGTRSYVGEYIAEAPSPYGKSDELTKMWADSPWARFTDEEEPVEYFRATDDSMAPMYKRGSVIAMRRLTADVEELPNGTPCVFGSTVKLLVRMEDDSVCWMPLNPKDRVARHHKVEFVALGSVEPRVVPQTQFPMPPMKSARLVTRKAA